MLSMEEAANALSSMAPALDRAWTIALADEELWRARAKRHGWLRTWWLRRQLTRRKRSS